MQMLGFCFHPCSMLTTMSLIFGPGTLSVFQGVVGPFHSSAFVISHFKQKSLSPPKTLSNRELDTAVVVSPSLSLSPHGIQIIGRASLCCCMEGMGVFELDLLDNIGSAHTPFHARVFHDDNEAQMQGWETGMFIMIWGKFNRGKSLTSRYHFNILLQ